jgi:diadenylate cyclase
MATTQTTPPLDVLRRFAPGTVLREAARLIFNQGTGALIVIGPEADIAELSTGGFKLVEVPVTAPRIAELAKMDGGIVVDEKSSTIVRANVHFIPDPNIPTRETGTRFRTAERIARQTGLAVLAVSEEGRNVAVLFSGDTRVVLQPPGTLLAVANQRLQALERLRRRLDEAIARLTQYEEDEIVTLRDAVLVIQRAALVLRNVEALEALAVELGDEAPMVQLQAEDLGAGVARLVTLVNVDYQRRKPRPGATPFRQLAKLSTEDLHHTAILADALGLVPLDDEATPRGARALASVPRLPENIQDALLRRFGSYPRLKSATVDELSEVEGVGPARATRIRAYLDQFSRGATNAGYAD